MAEMGAAVVAGHFGAGYAKAVIGVLVDQVCIGGRMKAWPAAASVEFCLGTEKRRAAADAAVGAGLVAIPVFAGKGTLGALAAGDVELVVVQLFAPFGIGFFDFRHVVLLQICPV